MSLITVLTKVETFVAKEVKGAENLAKKAETVFEKVEPLVVNDLLPELKTLYSELQTATPQVEADIATIAEIIADIETL